MGNQNKHLGAPTESPLSGKKRVRAAIYARYSSDMQKQDSIEDQVKIISKYVETGRVNSKKWPDGEIEILSDWIISDEGKSGKTINREGYLKILHGLRTNAYDLLLVDSLSRASRQMNGLLDLWDEIKFQDKELISVSEGQSTEDQSSQSMFVARGMASHFENELRSNCTRRGMIAKYMKGYVLGDVPYGYRTKSTARNTSKGQDKPCNFVPEICEHEAEIIRRIYKMYADGMGMASICSTLNRESIPCPGFPKKTEWGQTTVNNILENEKYIGVWVWSKGKWLRNPSSGQKVCRPTPKEQWVYLSDKPVNGNLAIIREEDLWNRVRAIKQSLARERVGTENKQRKLFARDPSNATTSPLTGLVRCAVCGGNMIMAAGKYNGCFGCFNAYRKATCTNRSLTRRSLIEEKVIGELKRVFQSDSYAEKLAEAYNQQRGAKLRTSQTKERELAQELQRLRIEIENLVNDIERGGGSEAISKRLRGKEQRAAEIEKGISFAKFSSTQKTFVIPATIKERLNALLEILAQDRVAARQIIQKTIAEPIRITNSKDIPNLEIKVAEFTLLNEAVNVV